MDPTIQGAVIGVVGGVAGAVLAGWFQRSIARDQMKAELQRLREQIAGESRARLLARKEDILLEGLSEVVTAADPERRDPLDYDRVLTLIHRCQLVLDVTSPAEATLNGALTALGLAVQEGDAHEALSAQSAVTEAGRAYFRRAQTIV